ncbi:VTT domain-containing protein [Aestuariibacter halophilus]|uniref:TVP38/TMEM64 family membrane protein n=1 Tax=Fluctibacter halophilus TaxID=226011 RepID=A0ABS8G912_9ALTE|nr:VTT domain-containing protein [Aestuariibacter halophilus]MCC2617077.1 VTT domain-containing protein [Aestuariibacter halophilus]
MKGYLKRRLKPFVSLTLFLVGGWLLATHPALHSLNSEWIDVHIRHNGLQGIGTYLVMGALACAVGVPRQLIAFLGGYAFGFVVGTALSTLAVTFGCVLSFYSARLSIRELIHARFGQRIVRIDRFLAYQPMMQAMLIRLFPVGNNLITNLIAGVTHVSGPAFIAGSLIGYIPQMAIFALMGKGIVIQSMWKVMLSVALFVLSSLLSWHLYRRYSKQQNSPVSATDAVNQST